MILNLAGGGGSINGGGNGNPVLQALAEFQGSSFEFYFYFVDVVGLISVLPSVQCTGEVFAPFYTETLDPAVVF